MGTTGWGGGDRPTLAGGALVPDGRAADAQWTARPVCGRTRLLARETGSVQSRGLRATPGTLRTPGIGGVPCDSPSPTTTRACHDPGARRSLRPKPPSPHRGPPAATRDACPERTGGGGPLSSPSLSRCPVRLSLQHLTPSGITLFIWDSSHITPAPWWQSVSAGSLFHTGTGAQWGNNIY